MATVLSHAIGSDAFGKNAIEQMRITGANPVTGDGLCDTVDTIKVPWFPNGQQPGNGQLIFNTAQPKEPIPPDEVVLIPSPGALVLPKWIFRDRHKQRKRCLDSEFGPYWTGEVQLVPYNWNHCPPHTRSTTLEETLAIASQFHSLAIYYNDHDQRQWWQSRCLVYAASRGYNYRGIETVIADCDFYAYCPWFRAYVYEAVAPHPPRGHLQFAD